MEIRTDIPIPADRPFARPPGRSAVYPFAELPVGGSFGVEVALADKASVAARMWRARHPGWNFVGRMMADEYRIWRSA